MVLTVRVRQIYFNMKRSMDNKWQQWEEELLARFLLKTNNNQSKSLDWSRIWDLLISTLETTQLTILQVLQTISSNTMSKLPNQLNRNIQQLMWQRLISQLEMTKRGNLRMSKAFIRKVLAIFREIKLSNWIK